jgi:seryl-tRNA synthetase
MMTTREISSEGPMALLARRQEWVPSGGEALLGSHMSALVDWVDSKVVELAMRAGAHRLPVPPLIERSILERAGYFESFPGSTVEQSEGGCMPPAVCYHCFAKLASTFLPQPSAWTCVARCRRNEHHREQGRLRAFTMREIVFVGPAAWVAERRQEWMDDILTFAQSLQLAVQLAPATDSFFTGGEARGRKLLQQIKGLKFELRAQMDEEGTPLAISSFNLHETFFSRRFGFRLEDGTEAYSGCVAFGLERWALALAVTLGPDKAFRLAEGEKR